MKLKTTFLLSLAVFSLAGAADAQTLFWDGGTANIAGTGTGVSTGGAGTWNSTIANWDQGSALPFTAWESGSNAFFGGTGGVVTLGASETANIVTITNKTYGFTDGGNTANVLTVTTISNSTGGGASTPTIMTNNLANSSTLNVWCPSSDLRLDGANGGLTGTLMVNSGTVEIGDGSVYNGGFGGGWSGSVASGATLQIRNITTDTAVGNTFSGQGTLEIQNKSGVITILTGNNTLTGTVAIASGELVVESASDSGPNPLGTGPLEVGINGSTSTFNYQGSSAYTTTRPLLIGGNGTSIITGLNGEAIVFNGPFYYGPSITAATKTLELTGAGYTDQGINMLNCNLTNFGSIPLIVNKQSGIWMLGGSNTFTGGLTFTGSPSGAYLYISNDFALGVSNGGIFFTNGGGMITSTNANVIINSSRTITVNTNVAGFYTSDSNNLTVAALITGTGSVSKASSSYLLGAVRFSNDANNYTNNFSMGFGVTEITSVADAGVACSLGAGTMITNNNGSSFAILRYVGVNNCATHRPLNWIATTGGLGLDNTNTGTVAYLSTANLVNAAGSKTLTLEGTNPGTNTLAQVLNDDGGSTSLVKEGPGEWILTGTSTASGTALVEGGTLLVNGAIGVGAVTVTNDATLAGSGTIGGAVTVATDGTLAAGTPTSASVGTLTFGSSVTNFGTIYAKLNKTAATCDKFTGISTLVYGGTLSLTNLSGTLTTTDTFKIFSAASYQGAFTAISPATPGPGLVWNTNNLTVSGTLGISTAPVASSPTITGVTLSGTSLSIAGTNGTALGQYIVLTATNISTPLTNWIPVATNNFDGSGNFSLTTNLNVTVGQQFFILSE